MLKYTFYKPSDIINTIDSYFNHNYKDEWMDDPFVKEMVLSIDKTEVVSPTVANSPIFGIMPMSKISGGVKALILMLKTDLLIYAPACGDNCTEYMIRIGEMKDCTIYVGNYMDFPRDFTALCIDNGEVTNTVDEFDMMCLRHFELGEV